MENTVQSQFQYSTPRIIGFDYTANTEAPTKEWTLQMTHQKSIQKISDHSAVVSVEMKICAPDDEAGPFTIRFVAEATFEWAGYDNGTISRLLSQNAPSLIIGHIRPLISLFTNSSGFIPFNLPFLDLTNESIIDFASL